MAFELNRRLAERVRKASSQKDFPLVLSGNCNSALGTLAGLNQPDLGMIWFDAHGDFNTPETTESTFFAASPDIPLFRNSELTHRQPKGHQRISCAT